MRPSQRAIPTRYSQSVDRAAADALKHKSLFVGGTSAVSSGAINWPHQRKFVAAIMVRPMWPDGRSDVHGQRLITTMIPLPGHSGIPTWEAPEQIKLAVSPTPTHVSQKSPRPVPAEIPQFNPSTEPEYRTIPRPGQNAEMLR